MRKQNNKKNILENFMSSWTQRVNRKVGHFYFCYTLSPALAPKTWIFQDCDTYMDVLTSMSKTYMPEFHRPRHQKNENIYTSWFSLCKKKVNKEQKSKNKKHKSSLQLGSMYLGCTQEGHVDVKRSLEA